METARREGYVSVTSSKDIDAPIETVRDVTTDPQSFVEGIDWVFEAGLEDGSSLGEGGVYIERAKPGLREGIYRWEITDYEPPTRIVHSHREGEIEAERAHLTGRLSRLGSTASVCTGGISIYGSGTWVNEERYPTDPSVRSRTGLIAERTILDAVVEHGVKATVLRPAPIYGPGGSSIGSGDASWRPVNGRRMPGVGSRSGVSFRSVTASARI